MIIGLGKEIQLSNIYDEEDRIRRSIYIKLEQLISSFPKNQIKCIGKYKNGLSMDFCEICAKNNLLQEVIIPYKDNDNSWPNPIKERFKKILKQSRNIKTLSGGTFNPKKIKEMDNYVSNKSDIIIEVTIVNSNPIITIVRNNEH